MLLPFLPKTLAPFLPKILALVLPKTPAPVLPKTRAPWRRVLVVNAWLALLLAGCANDPVPVGKLPDLPGAYPHAGSIRADGAVGTPDSAATKPAERWWEAFQDPQLNALVAAAQARNLDVRMAVQRVRQARAGVVQEFSRTTPEVGLTTEAIDQRSGLPAPAKFGFPDAQGLRARLNLAWELDLMGGGRAGREAANADLNRARWAVAGTQLMVAGEMARQYLNLRSLQRTAAVLDGVLLAQRETLRLTELRAREGQGALLDVDRANNALATADANRALLDAQQATARNAIALLLGDAPGSTDALLAALADGGPVLPGMASVAAAGRGAALAMPPNPVAAVTPDEMQARLMALLAPAGGVLGDPGRPPTGQPADLLLRRPDLQAALQAVIGAEALRREAHADRYPRVFLNALFGGERLNLNGSQLAPARYSNAALAFQLPLFDSGRRAAVEEQQAGLRDEQTLAFEQAVLRAVQEVDSSLAALQGERDHYGRVVQARDLALAALGRVLALQREGEVDHVGVLDLERSLLGAQLTVLEAERARAAAAVQVYQALGGGWAESGLVPQSGPARVQPESSR